jgi:outer membrane protein TolC
MNRQTLVNLRTQQMISSVNLVQTIGGGWDASQPPEQTATTQLPKRYASKR